MVNDKNYSIFNDFEMRCLSKYKSLFPKSLNNQVLLNKVNNSHKHISSVSNFKPQEKCLLNFWGY